MSKIHVLYKVKSNFFNYKLQHYEFSNVKVKEEWKERS